ncbi:MAG: ZIP family metal transporter [Cumulibacter sp.]
MITVIIFSLIGGLVSLTGALLLFGRRKTSQKVISLVTAFAAGVLLATAFTDILPESIASAGTKSVLTWAMLGVLGSFMLERFLSFFHHHHDDKDKNQASSSLIIIGDTLHNAIDGLTIGAAFLISPSAGIVTALAVSLHEVPQEIGDFGILIKNGMDKSRVVLINVLSALATTVTAVGVYAFGEAESPVIPYVLAVTAGFFIYIATSDLMPQIHAHGKNSIRDPRPWLLLFGAVLVMTLSPIVHEYIEDHDTTHSEHATE